ncbi:acyl-CoA synthetase (AMP-forming)/AMP-acid ligase II (plasmid) [Hoeflea sp. IMCC20628]|uniref:AMP-binding protein n=1 Tax=Hoeflea sp. IMCC20628 TaxID=1620421 RepID=UPI00063AF36D|nr:AMP-binding protein [Hoeflea sp. IMCC20628]AKI03342.1 acyl-CoA synthetase (AMP-forming)/AMP-acid ligase II [Hoeflea sp. IMCC20628]
MFDTIPDMAAKRAEISPNSIAFIEAGSGREWRFSEINSAANAVAAGLGQAGLCSGDRLAILCLNRVEFFITLFACQKTGIILCPLNWRQPAAELIETLEPVGAKALIHDAAQAELAGDVGSVCGIRNFAIETDISAWIETGATVPATKILPDQPWYLLFTSGTTGRPKAVIQTAQMAWANAVNISQATRMTADDRSVNFLPLFHTAGINLYTLPLFLLGGCSTVLLKFEPGQIFDLLKQGKITQFFGVPAIYQVFSLLPDVAEINWSVIRCGCGGAPLPEPLIRLFASHGAKVLNGMGMTETGPTVFLMDPENAERKIGSVGRAQMLTEMRLEGVAAGERGAGEIQLRGPNITPGYYLNERATRDAFTEDGWLRTGDVGRRDEDGYIFIVDRIKDMYISGGENVYPAEVERVLNEHADVLEAAVISMPDAKWGEVGAAFIIARPGATLDPAELRSWSRERMAAYKVPVKVTLVQDFPRTAAGKVRKPELRTLLP